MKTKQTPSVTRLKYLSSMLNKYSNSWGENPSARMCNWVDEYNMIKSDNPSAWESYCEIYGFCTTHDAYDNLA